MDGDPVKVLFKGPGGEVETLWANRIAPDRFALDNLPWFAYSVSLGDVVEAEPDETGMLTFKRVVVKSGNRTFRVIPDVAEPGRTWTFESQRLMDTLIKHGCSFEGANRSFVAVNVPPAASFEVVVDLLTASGCTWEYADPSYEDLFPGGPSEAEAPDV
jgi:hypothetical protein